MCVYFRVIRQEKSKLGWIGLTIVIRVQYLGLKSLRGWATISGVIV